jgi:two-component system OmpR family response regulator
MRRPGRVLSRLDLLEHAMGLRVRERSNVIDVYVRYLREKIDRPFGATRSRRCAAPGTGCAHDAA